MESEQEGLTPKMSLVSTAEFDFQHVFHYECLEQWFMENTTCPMCNLDYSKQTISMLRSLEGEGEQLSPQAQHIYDRFVKIREQYSMRTASLQRM